MLSFDFVTDSELRTGLQDDYREMERCHESTAWKAVHVLAGSIVEAILADHLVSSGVAPQATVLKWPLARLVEESGKAGVLTQRTIDLSSAVREFRNLIHPGRNVRLSATADANGATVVRALVDIVAKEVAEQKKKTYGYTADQLLAKLERDNSVAPMLKHLVSETNEAEVRRLLLELIPMRLLDWAQDDEIDPRDEAHLGACHRHVAELAGKEIRIAMARRFVEEAKSGSSFTIQVYLNHLFRGGDLEHLDGRDRRIALDRLLGELKEAAQSGGTIPEYLVGLAAYLTDDDVEPFVDALCRAAIKGSKAAKNYLRQEYSATTRATDELIVKKLKRWVSVAGRRGGEAPAVISGLIEVFDSDLPF